MNFPAISIIIPCYNSDDTLAAALDSVLALEYPEFELVLVDDCSTDGSWAIAVEYAARDGRIRLFRLENNSGVQAARDYATRQARFEWIASTDSDAVLPADWLFKASRHFKEADMVGGGFIAAPRSYIEECCNLYYANTAAVCVRHSAPATTLDPPAGGFNIFYKKEVFFTVGGYDREVKAAEDILLVARGIEAGFTYIYDTAIVVGHPFNPRSLTFSEFARRYWQLHKWRKSAGRKCRLIRNRNRLTVLGGGAVLLLLLSPPALFGPVYGAAASFATLVGGVGAGALKLHRRTSAPLHSCMNAVMLKLIRRILGALALATPGEPTPNGWSKKF